MSSAAASRRIIGSGIPSSLTSATAPSFSAAPVDAPLARRSGEVSGDDIQLTPVPFVLLAFTSLLLTLCSHLRLSCYLLPLLPKGDACKAFADATTPSPVMFLLTHPRLSECQIFASDWLHVLRVCV